MFGRLVEHDPRSRGFPALTARPTSKLWTHSAPVLHQGDLSSCTGNALAQCLNTTFFTKARPKRRYLGQEAAVELYSLATRLDEFHGEYPPRDTGSSGLGVCKAGVQLGYLTSYRHAFGFDDAISALALSPAIAGFGWYEQMMNVDQAGFIRVGGRQLGGHEVAVLGVNMPGRYIVILNSWSGKWGRNGRARISFDDLERLLDERGDVTIPVND